MKDILYRKKIYKEAKIKINNKEVIVVFKFLRPNKIQKIKNKYKKEIDKDIANNKIIIEILAKSIYTINGKKLEELCNEKCSKKQKRIKVIENFSKKTLDKFFEAYSELIKEIETLSEDEKLINSITDNGINKIRFKLSILMGIPFYDDYFNSLTTFEWVVLSKLLEEYERDMYVYHRSLLEYAMAFVAPEAVREHIKEREMRESLANEELKQIVFDQVKNLDKIQSALNKGKSDGSKS